MSRHQNDLKPGLYVYRTGDPELPWDWARVFKHERFSSSLAVEFIDPAGKTDLRLEKDSRDDRALRLKFRALDRFPHTLHGPMEPEEEEGLAVFGQAIVDEQVHLISTAPKRGDRTLCGSGFYEKDRRGLTTLTAYEHLVISCPSCLKHAQKGTCDLDDE